MPPGPGCFTQEKLRLLYESRFVESGDYTLHFNASEPSHLLWLNSLPGILSSGECYHPAEVRVVDIYKQHGREPTQAHLHVRSDTLPHAVAIAAVLTCQREQATIRRCRMYIMKGATARNADSNSRSR